VKTNNSEYGEYSVYPFGGVKVFTPLTKLTTANHELGIQSIDCTGASDETLVATHHAGIDVETIEDRFYAFADDSDDYEEGTEDMKLDD
jgi:hypothetical protein